MVDIGDLKSPGVTAVRVQVPLPAQLVKQRLIERCFTLQSLGCKQSGRLFPRDLKGGLRYFTYDVRNK